VVSLFFVAAAPIADRSIPSKVVSYIAMPAGQQAMHMPTDVALDSAGNVFICDGANNRIVRFNAKGEFVKSLEAALNNPVGIFIDKSDILWIADTGNHRVLSTTLDGTVKTTIDVPANKDHVASPTDLLLTPDGSRLYVVDNANHRVLARDQKTGTYIVFGSSGKALGQFQYPFMIALGEENYLYITESIGARVQMLSPTDRWAGQISRWGVELGQLYRPKGIAADTRGRIYVSDSTLNVIQVFTARGTLEGILTDAQNQPLRFDHPMGMAFDAAGKLYVVELKQNRVAVLTLSRPGGAP
jgi:DNA-binding beta-propeller fold protein YncE